MCRGWVRGMVGVSEGCGGSGQGVWLEWAGGVVGVGEGAWLETTPNCGNNATDTKYTYRR